MKKTLLTYVCAISILAIPSISPILPDAANADIYQWKDETGAIHFTDKPDNIPAKHRSRGKKVLSAPPEGNRPGLTIIKSPLSESPSENTDLYQPVTPTVPAKTGSREQVEQLQARISAKERFIESIDQKRSHAMNPLGNRFVSPEDQELYKKYSEELPQDRQKLREFK